MIEKEWLIKEIQSAKKSAQSYEENAFFQELEVIVREQYKRIEQAEGELDGSLWSPKRW